MTRRIAPALAVTLSAATAAFAQSDGASDAAEDGFLALDGQSVLEDAACGEDAAEWLNTTMVDLDGIWTLTMRAPLDGQDTATLEVDATKEGVATIGGGLFDAEIPLESAAGGGRPFEDFGLMDADVEEIESAIGCAIENLPRLSARGAIMDSSGQETVFLRLVVPSARLMVGSVQFGVGEDAETRLVRVTR